jgi:hypothetical protein
MEVVTMAGLLQFRSLVCDEPATSFGDDIELFVNGTSIGPQFPIDQGQSQNLAALTGNLGKDIVTFDDGDTVDIEFKEDTDPHSGHLLLDVPTAWTPEDQKTRVANVSIKNDGRYRMFYKWRKV